MSRRKIPCGFTLIELLVAIATIGVLARFALRRYLQSSIYTGEGSD